MSSKKNMAARKAADECDLDSNMREHLQYVGRLLTVGGLDPARLRALGEDCLNHARGAAVGTRGGNRTRSTTNG